MKKTMLYGVLCAMFTIAITLALTGCVFDSEQDDDDTTVAWEFPCDESELLAENGECVSEPTPIPTPEPTLEPTPQPTEEPVHAYLEVIWTTWEHISYHYEVYPGWTGQVLGTYLFRAIGGDINVERVWPRILVSDTPEPNEGYLLGWDEDARAQDGITSCVLRTWPQLTVIAGPAAPMLDGRLDFMEDFVVSELTSSADFGQQVEVVCDFSGMEPHGGEDAYAINMPWYSVDAWDMDGNTIPVHYIADNGNPPQVAVHVVEDPEVNTCSFTIMDPVGTEYTVSTTLTVSLSSGTPSGAAIPGMHEAMRFNLAANSCGAVYMESIYGRVIHTDDASSGWASNMADRVWLVSVNDPSTIVARATQISTLQNGTALLFQFDPFVEIPAGQVMTLMVMMDSTGASSMWDDSVRVELGDFAEWTGTGPISDYPYLTWMTNSPIVGGTLVF